jgi:hypothetical protein
MKEKKELANTGCNWAIEFSIYKTRALFAMLAIQPSYTKTLVDK